MTNKTYTREDIIEWAKIVKIPEVEESVLGNYIHFRKLDGYGWYSSDDPREIFLHVYWNRLKYRVDRSNFTQPFFWDMNTVIADKTVSQVEKILKRRIREVLGYRSNTTKRYLISDPCYVGHVETAIDDITENSNLPLAGTGDGKYLVIHMKGEPRIINTFEVDTGCFTIYPEDEIDKYSCRKNEISMDHPHEWQAVIELEEDLFDSWEYVADSMGIVIGEYMLIGGWDIEFITEEKKKRGFL